MYHQCTTVFLQLHILIFLQSNSDIWRDFPRFLIPIFRLLYLTPQQGCQPVVEAATRQDFGLNDDNDSDSNDNNRDGVNNEKNLKLPLYVQPYWIPSFSGSSSKSNKNRPSRRRGTPFPVFEMMGPFAERAVSIPPRLPEDGGLAASRALWTACQQLTDNNINNGGEWSLPSSSS